MPPLPERTEPFVLGKLDFVEVVSRWRGELNLKLHRMAVLCGVVVWRSVQDMGANGDDARYATIRAWSP